jgi:hypothetical protein
MRTDVGWARWTRFVVLACVAGSLSCGDDSTAPPPPDPDAARAAVQQANTALADLLYAQINGNPQQPSDVDFGPANALYNTALGLDPANLDARFGAGLTGLLMLSTDSEVNAAYNEWKTYLDTHTPFEAPPGPAPNLGVPIGLTTGAAGLRLPFDLVAQSALALVRTPILAADPQIERVQAILRDRALPRLGAALGHLQTVAQDPNYTFTVTPRMQGDLAATPAEIDQTDVLALRAGCGLLAAASHIAVAYRLGFAAYDSVNLVQNLQRGSGWLALLPDGAAQMGAARTACLEATNDVDRSLVALLAESDVQDDDVIKIGPSDLARADVDSIRANLPNVRSALNGGYTRRDDWDSDSSTPDTPLTIDLGHLFTSPVQDWKELLPAYSISTERRPRGYNGYQFGGGVDSVTVAVASTADYYGYLAASSDLGNPLQVDFEGDDVLHQPLLDFYTAKLEQLAIPNCFRGLWLYATFQGHLDAGTQQVPVRWEYQLDGATSCVVIPVITWDAESFEAWTFPDPTLGGVLPQMTSTAHLMSTFGVDARRWQQRWELDWSGY